MWQILVSIPILWLGMVILREGREDYQKYLFDPTMRASEMRAKIIAPGIILSFPFTILLYDILGEPNVLLTVAGFIIGTIICKWFITDSYPEKVRWILGIEKERTYF